ncbi:Lcl domain-containing protein [Parabacteroides sp.]
MTEKEILKLKKENYTTNYLFLVGISLWLLIGGNTGLSAQTATAINGYPVIDLSAWKPLGAVLSSSEAAARTTAMKALTPAADKYSDGVDGTLSGMAGEWNAKMSSKYQVMKEDYNSGEKMIWVEAWNKCKAYSGSSDGGSSQTGQWRLPTQRELLMIWTLQPQLIGKGGFSPMSNSYWTSTESATNSAFTVRFDHGSANSAASKTSAPKLRCVRDL